MWCQVAYSSQASAAMLSRKIYKVSAHFYSHRGTDWVTTGSSMLGRGRCVGGSGCHDHWHSTTASAVLQASSTDAANSVSMCCGASTKISWAGGGAWLLPGSRSSIGWPSGSCGDGLGLTVASGVSLLLLEVVVGDGSVPSSATGKPGTHWRAILWSRNSKCAK